MRGEGDGVKPLEYLRSRDVRVLALAMAYSRVMRQGRPVEKREKRPAKVDSRQLKLKGLEPKEP